ncbi:Synaptic vesicle glycoprotein 2B [Eufriesea mexicana]|uniref:Synaptic vesicle glycoprotein 2B n=1 Tax=Eufriesea mexicana TaxID=516756 RepID=A0A310S6E6_9HYME|nr:PREDICTED: synaptic vesicle glycoprotein 2B-like [Eufriesea mexicana]OAD47035.1 Synaptic vesicle glycoprotein 2B [Eufriesea mexicana]
MSHNHRSSIISVADNGIRANKSNFNFSKENRNDQPANFETAIAVAGCGKFQYLLLLAIIPVSWASSIDTSSIAIILPAAGCDLQMTFFQKGFLNAIVFVGMVSSGYLWGYIADVRGRRAVFLYGYLADGICNVLSGFSQDFWTLAFFKFLSGFIVSGPHASIVTYTSEFYGIKGRGKIPLLVGYFVTCGNIVSAALALLIIPQRWSVDLWDGAIVYNSWRIFLSSCGVPILIGLAFLSLFPESPKFLMSQGRMEDAMKVFKTIYRINTGKPAAEYPIQHLENDLPKEGSDDMDRDGKIEKKAIFFYPYLSRILLVTVMQFGSMYATNTIRLWQPQLFTILENFDAEDYDLTAGQQTFCEILDLSSTSANASATGVGNASCANLLVDESVYVNTIIVYIFSSFPILLTSFLLNILNHKILLYICYGISFACIVYINWSSSTLMTLLLASLIIGLMNTTLSINVAATVILFPTSLRTIAVSLVMLVGRIGSIVGNLLFPVLLAQGCLAPMIKLACLVLLCSILTCFLPLTKKKAKQ